MRLALAILLAASVARAAPGEGGKYGLLESGLTLSGGTLVGPLILTGPLATDITSSSTAVHAATANGLIPGHFTTDAATPTTRVAGTSAWAAATINTSGGTLILQGGLGVRRMAITAANCGADTIVIRTPSTNTGTENGTNDATHFDCTGESDASCATNIATWANQLTGVTATANSPTSGTVYIQVAESEKEATVSAYDAAIAPSDPTCAVVVQGFDGAVSVAGGLSISATNRPVNVGSEAYPTISALGGTFTLADGTTLATWRQHQFNAPSVSGVSGGGTETITDGATLYVAAAPSGSNITFTNGPYSLWVDAGATRLDGDLDARGLTSFGTATTVTVDGATTFAAPSSYFILACTGAETINTITGAARAGTIIYIENSDTDCTIADDDVATASNAIDLTGAGTNDVGAVAKVLALIYTGSSWMELFESDN